MSKYLAGIQNAVKLSGDSFTIPGDGLLVERLPPKEAKSKSGIILDHGMNQHNGLMANVPLEVVVVAVGAGFYEEDKDVPLDTQLGDILIVGEHTVKWYSTFPVNGYTPNSLGLCNESATQIRFRGQAAYEAFERASASTSAEVEDGKA